VKRLGKTAKGWTAQRKKSEKTVVSGSIFGLKTNKENAKGQAEIERGRRNNGLETERKKKRGHAEKVVRDDLEKRRKTS